MDIIAHPPTPGWRREATETLRLAWPLALANLLQMLTYAIDVIFIARLGAAELAASSLSVSLFGLLVWALTGLTGAVAPIAAAQIGARGPALRPVRRTVRMALWQAVLLGGFAMVPCALARPIMLLAGQEPRIASLAGEYMSVLMFAVVPMIAAGVLRHFVSTLGRPVFATLITGLGILVNSVGNYAFIFGNLGAPEMGLRGAGLATVLTSVAIFLAYVMAIRFDRRLHTYRVFGSFWRPDWPRFFELLRIGTPIALTILAEAGVFGAAAFLMGLVGAAQLAAHTFAIQIAAFAFQLPFGVSQATTIRVGLFSGARDAPGVKRAGWTGIAIGLSCMMLTALAMLLAPEFLLSLYLETEDPANAGLIGIATSFLVIAAAFQLSDGLQVVAAGALRGLKDTKVPMLIALFAYWGPGFGLAVILGFGIGPGAQLGGIGIWLGLAIGLTCSALMLVARWSMRERLGLLRA